MTDKPAESALDKAREEYAALRAALAPRNHVTHHTDCGCFTTAADALIAALEAENEALKCCGNCRHWWPGLLGCALDSSQEVVCEGRDRCKVFVQLADRPETREPSWTRRES